MSARPVVVIHGFLAPALSNLPVHVALRTLGARTFNVPIPGLNTQDIALSSVLLGERVDEVLRDTGSDSVDLVGVSMGGLIAVHYLRCRGGRSRVRRTVTLGSPLSGTDATTRVAALPVVGAIAARQMSRASEIVRAIDAAAEDGDDVVSIYAGGDAVVSEEAARLRGARLLKAPVGRYPFGHYQLVVDPRNLRFLTDQLRAD